MSEENEIVEGVDEPAPAENFEREAKIQGWVPAENFRGREEDWIDAETFVKRGRELNPILRANNKRLVSQVEQLTAAQADMARTVAEFRQYHEDTEARAYARAVQDLKNQRKQALRDNDSEAVIEAEEAIEALDTEMYQKTQARRAAPQQQGAVSAADVKAFTDRHDWFSTDKVKTSIVMGLGEVLHREHPELTGHAFLEELEQRMVEQFPQQFGNPRRNSASKVEGGSQGGSIRKPGSRKTAADLPPEARAAMKKYVGAKLLTEAQYLKDYFGDVE